MLIVITTNSKMTTGQKWLLGGTIVLLIVLGIVFRKQIASVFSRLTGGASGCRKDFMVKVQDLGDKKIKVLNITKSGEKYYKTEITIIPDGVESTNTDPIEIQTEERERLCKDKFLPPREYAWYYEKQTGGVSEGN